MKLNLVTSNIRFENPADGQHDWPYRRSFLTQIFHEHNSDIICTQEGRFPQLKDLESLLPEHKLLDANRDWISKRMYPCIYIKTKYEIINSGDKWLSKTPDIAGSSDFDSAFPRLMAWAHLKEKSTQKEFFLVNTHLDHVKDQTRKSQAQVIHEQIIRLRPKNVPLILCGDFNSDPGSEVYQTFSYLNDPWIEYKLEEHTTHHRFDGEHPEGSRIDWILHDKNLSCEEIKADTRHFDGVYPSDHFPIFCRLKFNE